MRVLLTGATGFIGSHVARALVARGDEVHAIVREPADLWRIAGIVDAMDILRFDLRRSSAMQQIAELRPDLCIHLAWHAVPGKYLDAEENLDLLTATVELTRVLHRAGCRKLVAAGSCLEYAGSTDQVTEESAVGPASLYAACKLACGIVLEKYTAQAGLEFAWLRIFLQYGPFEHENRLVASVIRRLLKGEKVSLRAAGQLRDFLHVTDVAAAVVAIADSNASGVINVGSGIPVSVGSVAGLIGELTGREENVIRAEEGPADMLVAGTSKLRRLTGWTPRYDLRTGLADAISWWRERLE